MQIETCLFGNWTLKLWLFWQNSIICQIESWSSYDFQQRRKLILKNIQKNCSKTEKFYLLIFVNTLSKLQIDQYPPQGERKQFSGQKINFKIFRVLNFENFSKISQNWRQFFFEFISIFLKKLKFFVRFHSGLSFVIHWCLNWFLLNNADAFSSGEKICWKRTKKVFWQFFKKSFLTGFYQKLTIIDPPYFLASAMVNTCLKLSILEKKKTKKKQ